jgi:ADP-L-glycero-D-manno-heptose 6-epimerase
MIVVTGGAGFIGSAIVWRLNQQKKNNIIIVDELGVDEKWKNLAALDYQDYYNKLVFLEKIEKNSFSFTIEAIIHMGANSSTTEKDADHLMSNNYEYTKKLAKYAMKNGIRFIYASSAATYGDGSKGFKDSEELSLQLRPLNMYGYSKNLFDMRAHKNGMFNKIVGLKYFNVYGPNEYHKGDMRSVVHKAFEQIRDTDKMKLFKSYHPDYPDGGQMRDFIHIEDAVDMTLFFLEHPEKNGLYNVGTGKARTWVDLVTTIFKAMNEPVNIEYIDMPVHLKPKYQYFTEADMSKIKNAGYRAPVHSLEEGVTGYVQKYLMKGKYLGEE